MGSVFRTLVERGTIISLTSENRLLTKNKSEYKMISVIHPAANHFPNMGSMPMLTGQTAAQAVMGNPYGVPFKADQISSVDVLYRRRGSGYTHLSNSWNTSTGVNMKNAVSTTTSRSLSNYQPAAARQHQAAQSAVNPNPAQTSNSSRGQQQQVVAPVAVKSSSRGLIRPPAGKDFSKPLFVDCSIEYELPNAPKIPKNSLPILMIHPGYQEKKRQQIQREQQIQQQQQRQQRQQQQQQLLMNIKNKDNIAVNNSKQTGCTAPNCHCRKIVSSMKPGTKRSYSNALGSNASTTTTQAQFYKQQQQQQQQLLQQQQKNRPAPPAHHAYFEAQAAAAAHANASSMSAASEAKRSRMMASVEQQKQQQQQQHQLLQYNHQQ